jgi:hypothetical protein
MKKANSANQVNICAKRELPHGARHVVEVVDQLGEALLLPGGAPRAATICTTP